MSAEITWLGHASFRIAGGGLVLYIDPWKLSGAPHDADVVFISHPHYDHYSPEDVEKVARSDTKVLAPTDTVTEADAILSPGDRQDVGDLQVQATPAYNPAKEYHPKTNNWLGAVFTIGGVRVYYAGDTELIDEMADLADIDVALLPVGGTYTMDVAQGVEACKRIGCASAIPYHWGDIVGSSDDAIEFEAQSPCSVHVLQVGQTATVSTPAPCPGPKGR